jgi:hypothetical protein
MNESLQRRHRGYTGKVVAHSVGFVLYAFLAIARKYNSPVEIGWILLTTCPKTTRSNATSTLILLRLYIFLLWWVGGESSQCTAELTAKENLKDKGSGFTSMEMFERLNWHPVAQTRLKG